jgi:hypothetical protein
MPDVSSSASVGAGLLPSGADTPPPRVERIGPVGEVTGRPWWRRVVAALVVLGGLALLAPAVAYSLRTTASLNSGSIISTSNGWYQQLTCYRSTIEHRVPQGAPVYLGTESSDEQLLVEASVTWASILPSPRGSRYTIRIVHGHGPCNGTSVEIRPG